MIQRILDVTLFILIIIGSILVDPWLWVAVGLMGISLSMDVYHVTTIAWRNIWKRR